MFVFVNDQQLQSDSYHTFKAKEERLKKAQQAKKWAPLTEREKEAQEEAYKAEYGNDYIPDTPANMQQIKDCLIRVNQIENAL